MKREGPHPRTRRNAGKSSSSKPRFVLCSVLIAAVLVACGAPAPPTKKVIVPDTTVELNEAARQALTELASDGTLRFKAGSGLTGQGALEPGDVLVSVPTEAAPNGLLRKVVSVREDDGELVVSTEQALLREAIYQGEAHLSRTLTPADLAQASASTTGVEVVETPPPASGQEGMDRSARPSPQGLHPAASATFTLQLHDVILFDLDGDESTTDDQVRANGSISFKPSFDLDLGLDYDWTSLPDLEVYFRAAIEENAALAIVGTMNGAFKHEVALATYSFAPIVVPFGIPLVFTPKLTLLLGADGKLTATASYQATQNITVAVGVENDGDHGWKDLSEVDSSFGGKGADFNGSVDLKGYASAKFDLFLYGLVGPYGRLNAFLELDGKIPRAPTWFLYGGLEAWAGIDSVDVLDLKYDKKIIDLRDEIARAGNSAPEAKITSAGGRKELNQPLRLNADVSDREDGSRCCDVTWTSNVDGLLGSGTSRFPTLEHTFTTEGTRIVTLTAKDSNGATSSDAVTLTVSNSPPNVSITKPVGAEEIYRGLPYLLRGTGSDPNEPGNELACDGLSWHSSLVVDTVPDTGCEGFATFDSNGPRTVTLTGIDPQGASSRASVDVVVVDPPAVAPPVVRILTPRNGAGLGPDTVVTLEAEATDPEGGDELQYQWTITYPGAGGPVTLPIDGRNGFQWAPSDTIPGLGCEFSMTAQLGVAVTSSRGATGRDYVLLWIGLIC